MSAPVVIRMKTGRTLQQDRRRAPRLEALAREIISGALAQAAEEDRAGLSRAFTSEAIKSDKAVRGEHEGGAWAAACARDHAIGPAKHKRPKEEAERVFKRGRAAA